MNTRVLDGGQVDALVGALSRPRPALAHTDMLDLELGKYLVINIYYRLIGQRWNATETSPGEVPVPHVVKLEIRVGDFTREAQMADLPRDLQEEIDIAILDHEASK